MSNEELKTAQLEQLGWLETEARDLAERFCSKPSEFRDMGRFIMEVLREQRVVCRDLSEDGADVTGGAEEVRVRVSGAFELGDG